MYFIKRAVVMAAGKGERMRPLTDKVAKPLIKVNGVRIIDTIINGLFTNGICEIYIIAGYKMEQFEALARQYPEVKIIYNPYYDTCNNISSLYVARNYLENAMILDGDQIIYNADVLRREFCKSGYNCIWTDVETKEWLLTVRNNTIIDCNREGGKRGWQLFSISRWNEDDGKKLKKCLEYEFEIKKNREIYWDDVVLFHHKDEFDLGIWEMQRKDVVEIDNITELVELDAQYSNLAETEK